jgi:hypothetical protein
VDLGRRKIGDEETLRGVSPEKEIRAGEGGG